MTLKKVDKFETITFAQNYLPIESVKVSHDLLTDITLYLNEKKARRAAVIASPFLLMKNDLVHSMIKTLNRQRGSKVHFISCSFFEEQSHRERILTIANKLNSLDVDFVVAVGGGSTIDIAKMVCFCLNKQVFSKEAMQHYAKFSNGDVGDLYGKGKEEYGTGLSLDASPQNPVAVISIPTTLSGASYSESASVLSEHSKTKEGYRDKALCPRAIFYNPQLTHDTPQWLWFSSAIRAMDHAIEGLCSPNTTSFYNAQFLQALRLFKDSLPALKANYHDDNARVMMQQAESFACSGLGRVSHGASHGIGYILTEMFEVPQGYASSVLLPAVLEWNQTVGYERQLLISEALGCSEAPAAKMVRDLTCELGLPTSLKNIIKRPIDENLLMEVAKRAFNHPVTRRNPRKIDDLSDILAILKLAM